MPTHYAGTPEEVLALDTFIKLTRATGSLLSRLSQRGIHPGITPSQFGVLETLYHLGPLCQSDLSNKLLMSGGNITLIIDNLQKRGLVTRQRSQEDRRFITVSLTEKGSELIARIFPAQVEAIVDEIGVLTPQEQQTLSGLCRTLGRQER